MLCTVSTVSTGTVWIKENDPDDVPSRQGRIFCVRSLVGVELSEVSQGTDPPLLMMSFRLLFLCLESPSPDLLLRDNGMR